MKKYICLLAIFVLMSCDEPPSYKIEIERFDNELKFTILEDGGREKVCFDDITVSKIDIERMQNEEANRLEVSEYVISTETLNLQSENCSGMFLFSQSNGAYINENLEISANGDWYLVIIDNYGRGYTYSDFFKLDSNGDIELLSR